MLINENRWRAQRYGFDQGLVDFGKGEIVPYRDLLEEMLELIAEDAAFFGCANEVAHARRILADGTSAHQQVRIFREALEAGTSREDALKHVVDWLIEETVTGLTTAPLAKAAAGAT
jgi:carboxylate-amine ligase